MKLPVHRAESAVIVLRIVVADPRTGRAGHGRRRKYCGRWDGHYRGGRCWRCDRYVRVGTAQRVVRPCCTTTGSITCSGSGYGSSSSSFSFAPFATIAHVQTLVAKDVRHGVGKLPIGTGNAHRGGRCRCIIERIAPASKQRWFDISIVRPCGKERGKAVISFIIG